MAQPGGPRDCAPPPEKNDKKTTEKKTKRRKREQKEREQIERHREEVCQNERVLYAVRKFMF